METRMVPPEVTRHLMEHIGKWPATKQEIMSACNNISDIPDENRKWVTEYLPEGTYDSPEEAEMVMERGMVQG